MFDPPFLPKRFRGKGLLQEGNLQMYALPNLNF